MERIQIGGRRVVGFGIGDAEDDPCNVGLFQGFFGKSVELPVLKSEDEQITEYMTGLNAAISGSCPTMREVDKGAWQAVFRKWQTLHISVLSFLDSPSWIGRNLEAAKWLCRLNNVRDQANVFQKMSAQCNSNATPNVPPPPKHKSEPSPMWPYWLGASAVAVVGAVVLTPILKEIVTAKQIGRAVGRVIRPSTRPLPEPE